MAAPGRIDWTSEARKDLARIHRFVSQQWSVRIAEKFLDLVMEFEDVVLRFPHGFSASPLHPGLRIGVIHRNVKAVYQVEPDRIVIIALLDTRADNSSWF